MNINDFPILSQRINKKKLVYLNSAATTQKPKEVIKAVTKTYTKFNSNIHRGSDALSINAEEMFEEVRKKVAQFIGAPESKQLIFTKSTTEGINFLANSFSEDIQSGDEIILSVSEHHANLLPWQKLQKKGALLKFVQITNEGIIDLNHLKSLINQKTKIISFTYVSNVLGAINPVKEICSLANKNQIITIIDGAQAVPHLKINVMDIRCDFIVFSAHKMLGPAGVGIVYARKEHLSTLKPLLYGGDMINEVTLNTSTCAEPPKKFEAGTQNLEGVLGFGAAIDYLKKIGMKKIREHDLKLLARIINGLRSIEGITIFGPKDIKNRSGLVSFILEGVHPHDLAEFLASEGIIIRSGHMCCQPLMQKLNIPAAVRASFYAYNTLEDIDILIKAIKKAKDFFVNGK